MSGSIHAPVTLAPTPVDEACFESAKALAVPFNTLVDRVATDVMYLEEALSQVEGEDEFTANTMRVWRQARRMKGEEQYRRQLRLGLFRSDYMIDESDAAAGPRLRQIELNTISSSFGPLGALVSQLHGTLYPGLPRNDTGNEFAHSIAAALRQWSKASGESDGVVLFVVQDGERNLYDQWWIADTLRSRFGVRTIRASLAQVAETSTVDDNGVLKVAGSKGEPTIRWRPHREQRCAVQTLL